MTPSRNTDSGNQSPKGPLRCADPRGFSPASAVAVSRRANPNVYGRSASIRLIQSAAVP